MTTKLPIKWEGKKLIRNSKKFIEICICTISKVKHKRSPSCLYISNWPYWNSSATASDPRFESSTFPLAAPIESPVNRTRRRQIGQKGTLISHLSMQFTWNLWPQFGRIRHQSPSIKFDKQTTQSSTDSDGSPACAVYLILGSLRKSSRE